MKNNVIKEEYLQEYENRVKSLHGIIVYAYYDYHYLMQIGERRKGYNLDCIFNIALNPAMEFLNSIIYSLQKEFILFVWGLKDGDKESNSIVQLKAFLHTCVIDFESKKKNLKKLNNNDFKVVDEARNKLIAHIEYGKEITSVAMDEVKNKLDDLRECFNSCLFGNYTQYCISQEMVEKIKRKCVSGVNHLLSGEMDKVYLQQAENNKNK